MDIKPSSDKRFALLIDADNVSAKYIKPILEELSKYGTVTYKRIYGDWTLSLHAKWKEALLDNSITPIQQFAYTQGKNATDSAMIIDAMDILYTNSVDGFCIVSSDSDFTRLVSRIRESGLMVIGMGEKKTPIPFRKACDIFTTLELLLPQPSAKQPDEAKSGQPLNQGGHGNGPSIEKVERAVVDIITDNLNNGKATGVGEVGSRLLKRWADFDVRSYGTNQLTKLLGEFKSVRVIKDGNSVTIELTDAAEAVREAGAKEAAAKEAAREAAAKEGAKEASGKKNGKDRGRDKQEKADRATEDDAEGAEAPVERMQPETDAVADAAPSGEPEEPAAAGEELALEEPAAAESPKETPEPKRGSRRSPRRRHSHVSSEAPEAPADAEAAAVAVEAGSAQPSDQVEEPAAGTETSEGAVDAATVATAGEGSTEAIVEEGSVADADAAKAASAAADAAPEPLAEEKKPGRKRSARRRSSRKQLPAEPQPEVSVAPEPSSEQPAAAPVGEAAPEPETAPAGEAAPAPAPAPEAVPAPVPVERPDDLVRQIVAAAGEQGIGMQELGRKIRSSLHSFKVHDYGFAQLRTYVADIEGIEVSKRGKEWVAVLAR